MVSDEISLMSVRGLDLQLGSVTIVGFRSILELLDLEIGSPILLAGHNDAGKTAILDSIRFLLNEYTITERDLTYKFAVTTEEGESEEPRARVGETYVKGIFSRNIGTDSDPSTQKVEIRRLVRFPEAAVFELLQEVCKDVELRNYQSMLLSDLRVLATNYGIRIGQKSKSQLIAQLDVVKEGAEKEIVWESMPKHMLLEFPRLEFYNPSGVRDAEESIRTTLQSVYKSFMQDDEIRGNIKELETSLENKLKEDARQIEEHIKTRCADIGEVKILPSVNFRSGLDATAISVTAQSGEDVHLGEAGAGRARRVSLAVWEYNTRLLADAGDIVILYDEPDIHLDYLHQRDFMRLVRDQCSYANIRMVIATHSLNLIDQIDIMDVIHIHHDESHRTQAKKLFKDDEAGKHLGEIASSVGLRNTVLLHERLFVGVEGASELAAVPVFFKKYKRQQMESFGIALWPCGNNVGALTFAQYLISEDREVIFVVDNDSRHKEKKKFSERALKDIGIDPSKHARYWGNPNEIEDLFSNDLWIKAANTHWKRTDGRQWVVDDIEKWRHEKFSDDILESFKTESEFGPSNKPEMLLGLALTLNGDELPEKMTEIFDLLIERANQG